LSAIHRTPPLMLLTFDRAEINPRYQEN
jgi:hypothetical protein